MGKAAKSTFFEYSNEVLSINFSGVADKVWSFKK